MNSIIKTYKKYTSFASKHFAVLLVALLSLSIYLIVFGVLSGGYQAILFVTALTIFVIFMANLDDGPSSNKDKNTTHAKSAYIGVVISVLIASFAIEGDTDIPPTHVGIFKLNQPIVDSEVDEAGLMKLEAFSTKGISVYQDTTRPEVEYEVKTDEKGLVYAIRAEIGLGSEDLADTFYDETKELWDAKFGGGNQGLDHRFHRDTRIVLSRWNEKTVRIYLKDLAADKEVKDKLKAIGKEKELLAFK